MKKLRQYSRLVYIFLITLGLAFVIAGTAAAQDRLYWDFPEPIKAADGGRFPQVLNVGDRLALVWQEFLGDPGSLDATISVKALFTDEALNWDTQAVTIAEDIPYLWLEEIPLFSAAAGADGRLLVAVPEARKGVLVYRQADPGNYLDFEQGDLIASRPQASDVAVAPRIVAASDGSYLLFLTRRTGISGGSRPTTLTIFTSSSKNGLDWSEPELFINPDTDRGIPVEGVGPVVLEQNFLPFFLSTGKREYVAFQTLREGIGQVYQIYLKTRDSGGKWGPAVPVTELLKSSEGENDPLLWDNQRPYLGLTPENEILVAWERRTAGKAPGVSVAVLNPDGTVASSIVEDVIKGRNNSTFSAFPRVTVISGKTWISWFDNSGIRLARRVEADNYNVETVALNSETPFADQNSATFPWAVFFRGNTYLLWQDRAGGLERVILLRPDLNVDTPAVVSTNFPGNRPGNIASLQVTWRVPRDRSGVLSYKWFWSRNPGASPADGVEEFLTDRDSTIRSVNYRIENPADNEGNWYFYLAVQDLVGNWSNPLRFVYNLDITPPPPPAVISPPTDAYGYLNANTFRIEWGDDEEEAASGYRWRLDYLAASPENLDIPKLEALAIKDPRAAFSLDGGVATPARFSEWRNLDNGVWAFTVAAIDRAGNQGLPNTRILLLSRYSPETFISNVTSRKDESERIILRIFGRGFSVGGEITTVIVDRDGVEPWDYQYTRSGGQLDVVSYDRIVEVTGIEDMEEGTYLIGVRHPVRGTVFWNRSIRLDSTGTVKFGPFGLYSYESLWKSAARSVRLTGNQLLYIVLFVLGLAAFIITATRLVSLTREARTLEQDARAIWDGKPLSAQVRAEAEKDLRRRGMGLRRKFTLALTILVVITITLIASVLGFVWIRMERNTLAGGLENESRLLVETLASSAGASLGAPIADRGGLSLLPDRIGALPDARWATITGPRSETVDGRLRTTSDGFNFVWASNDPDVLGKIKLPASLDAAASGLAEGVAAGDELRIFKSSYKAATDGTFKLVPPETQADRELLAGLLRRVNLMPNKVGYGVSLLDDGMNEILENMRQDVEQGAQDADITGMISKLVKLEEDYEKLGILAVESRDYDNPVFLAKGDEVDAQKKEIETLLLELSVGRFGSYPAFSAEALGPDSPEIFVFYKPILYRTGYQDANFFKGVVRLAVSVANIRDSLEIIRKRILIITGAAAAASLVIGIMVALFISQRMISPIRKLRNDVEKVTAMIGGLSDEKSKFDFIQKTGDEIQDLSESVHGFVMKLIQAEFKQKELIAGQAIQKKFLPLEIVKDDMGSPIKLSTGGDGNAFFRLFGYYEGADVVSGDYFDFRKLDEDHYVIIKMDISGHGLLASLIMFQVAALYVDYFHRVRIEAEATGRLKFDLRDFIFRINDLINEVGYSGRFAAFTLSVMNVRTSEYEMIHAGDNIVRIFDSKTKKMKSITMVEAPAAGMVESWMIRPEMYQVVKGSLNRGDVLFLYSDGIEEAHHFLRDRDFKVLKYNELPRDLIAADQEFIQPVYEYLKPKERVGEVFKAANSDDLIAAALDNDNLRIKEAKYKPIDGKYEEFDTRRIYDVIEAALNRTKYTLQRRCDLTIGKPLNFDFSSLKGTGEDAILALASVEKVFRIVPDESGGTRETVKVDKKIDAFLKEHFLEYKEFYHHRFSEDVGYVYFSHLKEDPQEDDLTLLAYERL